MYRQSKVECTNKHAIKSQTHKYTHTINEQNDHSKTQNFTLGKPIENMHKKVLKN